MNLQAELANYYALRQRVDSFVERITFKHADVIICHAGCDTCCRHLTLFPVEAYAIAAAVWQLSAKQQAEIRELANNATPEACPLLADGHCLLYPARPLICRTHGLPILVVTEGTKTVDCCPLNFVGVDTLSGADVISLDQLNEALAAVNALFVRDSLGGKAQERYTIAEALLL